MILEKVEYKTLSSKQKEIYNFQIAASFLAGYGFNCIKLADDWQGADFLAYHKDGKNTLKVQLKGRAMVQRSYIGKDLYMCFPVGANWYLISHDELLELVSKTGKCKKQSLGAEERIVIHPQVGHCWTI
jgi:hypothetical protein